MNEQLREQLAAYAHEARSGWMRWQFEQGGTEVVDTDEDDELVTFWTMKPEEYKRWQRQMNTPYADLPENEKESDRRQADKILALIAKDLDRLTQIALAAENLITEAWPLQEQFDPETYEVSGYRLRQLTDLIEGTTAA